MLLMMRFIACPQFAGIGDPLAVGQHRFDGGAPITAQVPSGASAWMAWPKTRVLPVASMV